MHTCAQVGQDLGLQAFWELHSRPSPTPPSHSHTAQPPLPSPPPPHTHARMHTHAHAQMKKDLEGADMQALHSCFKHLASKPDVELRRSCAQQLGPLARAACSISPSAFLDYYCDTFQALAHDADEEVQGGGGWGWGGGDGGGVCVCGMVGMEVV